MLVYMQNICIILSFPQAFPEFYKLGFDNVRAFTALFKKPVIFFSKFFHYSKCFTRPLCYVFPIHLVFFVLFSYRWATL